MSTVVITVELKKKHSDIYLKQWISKHYGVLLFLKRLFMGTYKNIGTEECYTKEHGSQYYYAIWGLVTKRIATTYDILC